MLTLFVYLKKVSHVFLGPKVLKVIHREFQ